MKKIVLYIVCIISAVLLINCGQGDVKTSRKTEHRKLSPPPQKKKNNFTFAVFGDRTKVRESDTGQSFEILACAVEQVNNDPHKPDLVFTIGDLVDGVFGEKEWLGQKDEYFKIMNKLKVPWYPVAGNRDIQGEDGQVHYTGDFEKYFGPLWYTFEYNDCWFVVLFTDGDAKQLELQRQWFTHSILEKAKESRHLFVFQHYPLWRGKNQWWWGIHKAILDTGVSCGIFAGHLHKTRRYKKIGNTDFFMLGPTGGYSPGDKHHYWRVRVNANAFDVEKIPIRYETTVKPAADK